MIQGEWRALFSIDIISVCLLKSVDFSKDSRAVQQSFRWRGDRSTYGWRQRIPIHSAQSTRSMLNTDRFSAWIRPRLCRRSLLPMTRKHPFLTQLNWKTAWRISRRRWNVVQLSNYPVSNEPSCMIHRTVRRTFRRKQKSEREWRCLKWYREDSNSFVNHHQQTLFAVVSQQHEEIRCLHRLACHTIEFGASFILFTVIDQIEYQ